MSCRRRSHTTPGYLQPRTLDDRIRVGRFEHDSFFIQFCHKQVSLTYIIVIIIRAFVIYCWRNPYLTYFQLCTSKVNVYKAPKVVK